MLPDWYPALVAMHIICMVAFFASSFCLLRLFLLHRQAAAVPEPGRALLAKQHLAMGWSLLYLVAWPSLLLLIAFGAWMTWLQPGLLAQPWMQAKLGLSALLVAYHGVDQRLYRKLLQEGSTWSGMALRLWAQVLVVLLCLAVFLSAFKEVQWYIGLLGLLVLALLVFSAIRAFGNKGPEPAAGTQEPGPAS